MWQGEKSCTRGHSHNCGAKTYRKGNYYCIWKVLMDPNLNPIFENDAECFKTSGKNLKKMGQKYSD
jgi:hypothetical protein